MNNTNMNVINNPAVLDELDDKTAISVAQKALRELDEMLRHHQESNKGPKGTQSDTRSRLERQRNVLLWQLRRRESRALAAGGPSSSTVSRPRYEPAETQPAKGQQEKGQRLGEPSSSSAVSGRRQQPSGSTRKVPGAWPLSQITVPLLSCNICMENHPSDDCVTFACNHHCCRECLNKMYKGATGDETRYPPRCCQPIPIEQSRRLLNADVLKNFLDKQVEWESKDRIYCSNKTCSAFIRPENIQGKKAKCLKCGTRTCADCKKAAHSSRRPCVGDGHGTRLALKVMEENKWRRCPGCNNGIERAEGCNHMECPCGRAFCYQCGAKWRECACPLFAVPTEQLLFRGFGLNNPTNRANVPPNPIWPPNPNARALAGPEPVWPPLARALAGPEPLLPWSTYGLNVPPNPVQSSNLENHSLASNLASLSRKSPDKKTASDPNQELKQDFRKIMDNLDRIKDKLRQRGYPISDSDTDSSSSS